MTKYRVTFQREDQGKFEKVYGTLEMAEIIKRVAIGLAEKMGRAWIHPPVISEIPPVKLVEDPCTSDA